MAIQRFEQLEVWQEAHKLVLFVYRFTRDLPKTERFGLSAQMRRSATSVRANIAEGFKRRGFKDKARFYNISQASLEELRYYFVLCRDLNFGQSSESIEPCFDRIAKQLLRLEQTVTKV